MRTIWKTVLLIVFTLLITSCENYTSPKNQRVVRINLEENLNQEPNLVHSDSTQPLNLAISAMTSPKETYIYYEKLVAYISQKLGKPIQFKQRKSYEEVNELLKNGGVDIAFICSGAYVAARPENYIEILAIPVVNDKPYYYAYIIVHKNSPYQRFRDLKKSRFAFTDPLSNTGYFYPLRRVKEMGYTVDSFFKKTLFTYAHDYSIQAVARKIVDGASVDGLIYDYLKEHNPKLVENVRIIEKSEPFGIPPVVVPRNLNVKIKKKLKSILLNLHKDEKGKAILQQLNIDRFVLPEGVDYSMVEKNMRLALE